VDVQTTGQGMIHFNREGYLPFGTIHDPAYWRIDSLPFAERRALLERGRQNKLAVGQEVWMQSGDEFQVGTVEEVTENYVRVALGERTGSVSDESLDFRYDGSQCGLWGGMDGWDSRPLCGPNLVPWRLTDKHPDTKPDQDTKILVTGPNIWMERVKQKIRMKSVNETSGETQFLEVTVTEITEKCVEVECPDPVEGRRWRIRFSYEGKQAIYDRGGFATHGLGVWQYFGPKLGWVNDGPWMASPGLDWGGWELEKFIVEAPKEPLVLTPEEAILERAANVYKDFVKSPKEHAKALLAVIHDAEAANIPREDLDKYMVTYLPPVGLMEATLPVLEEGKPNPKTFAEFDAWLAENSKAPDGV